MAASYYVVPLVGTGSREDPFRLAVTLDQQADAMPMGLEMFALVMIRDVTQASIDALNANPDVITIPPLNTTVTAGALPTVQAKLEACNIPSGWVNVGMPYSTIVHVVAAYIQLHQRYQGLNAARLLGGGVTLDTRINQLPAGVSAKLSSMADSFGFDRTAITGSTTLRVALKILFDQWNSNLVIGGEVI